MVIHASTRMSYLKSAVIAALAMALFLVVMPFAAYADDATNPGIDESASTVPSDLTEKQGQSGVSDVAPSGSESGGQQGQNENVTIPESDSSTNSGDDATNVASNESVDNAVNVVPETQATVSKEVPEAVLNEGDGSAEQRVEETPRGNESQIGEVEAFATASEPSYAEVARIAINKSKVKIKNDGKFRFKVTLFPDIVGKPIKNTAIQWLISNSKIASIDGKGLVRGKKNGTVTVTARAANGKTVKATVRVKINKKDMAKRIPVLTYHRICKDSAKARFFNDTNLAISASMFKKQMKWLKKHGYRTISTAEFKDWRKNGTFLPKKSVLITIDDGHYETYHVAYPILKKYKLKATSFIVGSRIGKHTQKYNPNSGSSHFIGKDVMKKMKKEYPNLEFQSHSYNMHIRLGSGNGIVRSMSKASIEKDFKKNEKYGFTAIAWPFGHTSNTCKAVAKASKSIGVAFGYMMEYPASRKSPLYNIPRFKVFGDRGLGDFIRIVSTAR